MDAAVVVGERPSVVGDVPLVVVPAGPADVVDGVPLSLALALLPLVATTVLPARLPPRLSPSLPATLADIPAGSVDEVILVDDGSRDRTRLLIQECCRTNPTFRGLLLSRASRSSRRSGCVCACQRW